MLANGRKEQKLEQAGAGILRILPHASIGGREKGRREVTGSRDSRLGSCREADAARCREAVKGSHNDNGKKQAQSETGVPWQDHGVPGPAMLSS